MERAVLRDGLCRRHPNPEWWTSGRTGTEKVKYRDRRGISQHRRITVSMRAKLVCWECPVIDQCRELSDIVESTYSDGEDYSTCAGVWAGEGPMERANRRKAARHAAAA